jgi:nitroreductase
MTEEDPMSDPNTPTDLARAPNPVLDFLLKRRSARNLGAPAPDDDELALILRAALRAPDFNTLRPYRFLAARGEGLQRLGAALHRAAVEAGKSEKKIARAASLPLRAPLVLVVVASPQPDDIVTPLDQTLCAGNSVLMLHLAARSLGYGSIWRSGWVMHDRHVHAGLNLAEHEQIVGFLYIGTSTEADEPIDDPDPFLRLTYL